MSGPAIITMGCRLNIAESEAIRDLAQGQDDLIVVNSCAVTAEAVRQTRQAIRRARRERPEARIMVTGCAAQTEPETFAAMAEVDAVIGNREKLDAETYQRPFASSEVEKRFSTSLEANGRWYVSASSFSRLPITASTSAIAANVSGSVWAAQPVTMIRASGRSRRARRMAWRVWRTASAVTAQLLTTIRSSCPCARSRIASLSAMLRRQPMVMMAGPLIRNATSQPRHRRHGWRGRSC